MGSTVKIAFLADVGKAQKSVKDLGGTVEKTGTAVESSSKKTSKGLNNVAVSAIALDSAAGLAGDALSSIDQIQNSARNEANRLARAQLDVEQAMADGEQAAIDLRQATEDLKQAQIDSKQAAVDIEQAQIDATQAALDVTTAQRDYKKAITESGAGSAEARQAAIDVKQAQADQKQATVDLTQAQADQRQSTLDASQAQVDSKQATIDAKDATLTLTEAQRAVDPSVVQQAMRVIELGIPILASATLATQALSAAGIRATVSTVAHKVATAASTAATAAATAAQWALNVALSANPIGLVIAAVIALIAVTVLAWQRSNTFRAVVTTAWNAVWGVVRGFTGWLTSAVPAAAGTVQSAFAGAINTVKAKFRGLDQAVRGIPQRIRAAFSGARSWLISAGRDVIAGLVDGIRSQFGRVQSSLGDLTGKLTSWKGPPSRDRRLLEFSGRTVIGGFLRGLESEYAEVRDSLSQFTDSLSGSADVSGVIEVPRFAGPTAGGTTDRLVLELAGGTTGDQLLDAIWDALRRRIRIVGRGDVQLALGR
jgi:hypothetical protein